MQVPFVDLNKQYAGIQEDIDQSVRIIFEKSSFAYDGIISQFENKFAQFLNAAYCIACGNCTDALEIILRGFDINEGDEVLVPANGWLSAAEAVCLVGGTPVFIDSHPEYYAINAQNIEHAITEKTKAIIPIHLYGLPANMDAIMHIANKYNLKVIEDCAQAHGATYHGKKAGTIGNAAAFSFYPTKNLGAYGDAGAIVTNDPALAEKCRMLANHGQKTRNNHLIIGRNSRMDSLQASILQTKLQYLDNWNEQRVSNAQFYFEQLKDSAVALPSIPENCTHVFHLFVIRVKNREQLMQKLKKAGIGTSIHYPVPLPQMPVFSDLSHPNDFPVANSQAGELLSLPIYPELTSHQLQYVVENIKSIVD